jgi:hypothetical protein
MVDTGLPGENHRPITGHWQTLSHNVVPRYYNNSAFKEQKIKKIE